MRPLLFNLATDVDDPILDFTTGWSTALAKLVERIYVITMRTGRVEMPDNVRVYSVGKEKGYSEPRRLGEFYWHLWCVLHDDRIDVCFSHMIPLFTVLGIFAYPLSCGARHEGRHAESRVMSSRMRISRHSNDSLHPCSA